jgi:hypothetical protein
VRFGSGYSAHGISRAIRPVTHLVLTPIAFCAIEV